jgi:hypothetical protein
MSARSLGGKTKRTRLGMTLEQSAKEILAHVKGEAELPTRKVVLPKLRGGLGRARILNP